jgi:glycosyltransferase involved in cell wall biosynthesis
LATRTPTVTVILPCLNESETLEICIRKARTALAALNVDGEVLVADNGSTDGSQDIARAGGARVIDVPVRGYGAALRAGIETSAAEFVIMADADDSYDLEGLEPFLRELAAGADLVMGDRFAGGIAPGAMPALHRYLGNPVLSWLGRHMFGVPVRDFHCGMRGFRRDRIVALELCTNGMEFASEMVVRAAHRQLDIRTVPTTLRPDGRSRPPHLRTWRDGWRHLRFLLALCPRWLFLYPALALMLLGSVAATTLFLLPVRVGGVTFDVETMLVACTSLIVGLQLASLALISRSYATRLGILPSNARLDRLLDRYTLEHGLVSGLLLGATGFSMFLVALLHWRSTGFGGLQARDMRVPLLGMVAMVAGAQVIFTSFTLSLIRIGDR